MGRLARTLAVAAVTISIASALADGPATPAADASTRLGPTPITQLSLSGPVSAAPSYSGHPPTAPPPGSPESTNPPGDGEPMGAESVIGHDDRERVDPTTVYPNSAVGHIELRNRNRDFLCTGFLIDDNSILTSGHCAYDPFLGPQPNPIESATWFPGRNRGVDPYGACPVTGVWAPPRFVDTGNPAYDFAVMNLLPACSEIGTETGTFGLFARDGSLATVRATVTGYPGEAVYGTMKRHRGKITKSGDRLIWYPMDTTGGQSGSPVWKNRLSGDCVGPCGLAVHGYGIDEMAMDGVWSRNNAGVRITAYRIGQILDIAGQND
jgi:glutamyl endopeptidase